jgi:hypothetical protein
MSQGIAVFDYDYPGNPGYEGEPELDEDRIDWDDEGAYDEED